MIRYNRVSLALLLLSTLAFPLVSESLRGAFKGELLPDAPALTFGLEDLVQITLPPATRFTKALEIEIQIPREALPYRSNFAVFVYQNFVAPKGRDQASGERVALEVLPPTGKFYLQAPLVSKAGLKASVDTAVIKIPQFDMAFPLAITVLPIDKELPPDIQKFQFQVKTRLINSNLGGLNVITPGLSTDDRKKIKLTANGVVQSPEGVLLLEPGLYTVEASLPGYTTASANVAVGQAKVTDVNLVLGPDSPYIVVEAPEGTIVVLDGKRLLWTPLTSFPIEAGTHNVQVSLGNTLVTQTFEVSGGGRYKINLQMQLDVEKE